MTTKAPTVLIIDDSADLQFLLQVALETEGYRVSTAADGEAGVAAIESDSESFDLILLDLMMPIMDGVRFLTWLRREKKSEIPVVVLSATGPEEMRSVISGLGATALAKPIDLDRLLNVARELIG